RFWPDDGRGLPTHATGAPGCRELSGHFGTRARTAACRILQRRTASARRRSCRQLEWLEPVACEHALSTTWRNHERSSPAAEIEMGLRICGRCDRLRRAYISEWHNFRGERGWSGAGVGGEDRL